ncbi:MAG: FG-GAP repeat protein, partial [Chloroflexi bacterium]|nr:FG-GAP repeat protein [Chloroflexota bacterium]
MVLYLSPGSFIRGIPVRKTIAIRRRRLLLLLLALGLLGGVVGGVIRLGKAPAAQAQVESTTEEAKLTASGGAQDDFFGSGLAVSGDTAVVGAYGDNSAHVFVRSEGSWTPQAKLTVSDGGAFDLFGWSVAISGDTAIVGAPLHTVGENFRQGSAYVFIRSGTSWSQEAKLTAPDGVAFDEFGNSVAI